jgi:hypothetical protein
VANVNLFIENKNKSTIDHVIIDVTLSERHTVSSEITENPVEEGAAVTDHVHINPEELVIDGIISDYNQNIPIFGPIIQGVQKLSGYYGETKRSVEAYNELVRIKNLRQPIQVTTGLKAYDSMIIQEISVDRDKSKSTALYFSITLRQIRIVSSKILPSTIRPSKESSDLTSKQVDNGQKVTNTVPLTDQESGSPGGITKQTQLEKGADSSIKQSEVVRSLYTDIGLEDPLDGFFNGI